MLVVDEEKLLPRLRVGETDAARRAGRARLGDAPHCTARGKRLVREREQRGEILGRQTGDAETHHIPPLSVGGNMRTPGRRNHPFPRIGKSGIRDQGLCPIPDP